ncbi:MAG TPA: glycosyltransferase family 1 protein [Thermodesulfobacteriaceae bacterium]|nr:glycosyltransferase family 1 protein [Thermodesulfobacteriaceae bacterium]
MSLVLCGPCFFEKINGEVVYSRILAKALTELFPKARVISLTPERPSSHYVPISCFRSFRRGVLGLKNLFETAKGVVFTRTSCWPYALLLYLRRKPYVFVLHGVEAWRRFPQPARFILARAQGFLSVSRYTAERFLSENAFSNPWYLLPPALDPYFRHPGPSPLSENGQYLMTVARLAREAHYKGVDLVIRALPELQSEFPNLQYVVIGGGDLLPRYHELAIKLGVSDRVHFLGERKDVARFLKAAEVFVLVSKGEGFGIVFLEAMYFRKPLLGASAGGIPEVVRDGVNGFLVPYGDLKALTAALKRLLSQKEEAQRLGEAGHRILTEEYTYETFKNRLQNILRALTWV